MIIMLSTRQAWLAHGQSISAALPGVWGHVYACTLVLAELLPSLLPSYSKLSSEGELPAARLGADPAGPLSTKHMNGSGFYASNSSFLPFNVCSSPLLVGMQDIQVLEPTAQH